jgi:uncharacterized protein YndB with AHSA1/START domain
MKKIEAVKVEARGDREIVMTRTFDAPPRLVFDAHTKPELVRRWLVGSPGWSMPLCEIDLKVGGKYRYVWRNDKDGTQMGIGGVYREIAPHERIVCTEKFDEAWYPGEAVVTTEFVEQDGKTKLTTTSRYESRAARDGVLKSGMESGLVHSYTLLADMLPALLTAGATSASGMAVFVTEKLRDRKKTKEIRTQPKPKGKS